jgi:hypothetical protein
MTDRRVKTLRKDLLIEGIQYDNVKEACEEYGITQQCYGLRRKKGYSIEQALTTPKYQNIDTKFFIERELRQLKRRAEKLGIDLKKLL